MTTSLRPPRASELDSGPAGQSPSSPLTSLGFETTAPTYAAFSPTTSLTGTLGSHRRSTILLHQKSPLLLATPPQITRALAYSHPFLAPLNSFLGLVSWSSGDPWESFLLVASWWGIVLYGDIVLRVAGPLVVVAMLILGMYGRRFSLLSSSGWSEFTAGTKLYKASSSSTTDKSSSAAATAAANPGLTVTNPKNEKTEAAPPTEDTNNAKKHKRAVSRDSTATTVHEHTGTKHQKTLDEIVATLRELTTRCNIMLEPFLEMTDFLSTQRTATTASTRPALTTLFARLLLCTPLWWALTLPPLRVVTTRRVVLVFGTIVLTWHARVMRVARAILWRSRTVRKVAALVTGLPFSSPPLDLSPGSTKSGGVGPAPGGDAGVGPGVVRRESELTKALQRQQKAKGALAGEPAAVRFTFIVYENNRRWVGLGWTTSLFSYERGAWTDEHNNPVPPREEFELPEVEEGARARWRWVRGGKWRVDGVKDLGLGGDGEVDYDGEAGKMGWVYYDNKWQNGRRGQDGWGRWTRRRKWYRDAELVELSDAEFAAFQEEKQKAAVAMAAAAAAAAKVDEETAAAAHATETSPKAKTKRKPPPLPPRSRGTSPHPAAPHLLPPQLSSVTVQSEHSHGSQAATLVELPDTSGRNTVTKGSEASSIRESIRERDVAAGSDTASIMSSSSRSRGFWGLGGGGNDRGSRGSIGSGSAGGSLRRRGTGSGGGGVGQRDRRASEAASEDAEAALGTAVGLRIQGAGGEGWGVGDEARMGLE